MEGSKKKTEDIEIDLLLEAIFQQYGYDFRNYARASVNRRVKYHLAKSGCKTIAEMIPRVLHDKAFFAALVRDFSIAVTEMFRDPDFYLALRQRVVPFMKTYPFTKAWVAGCATGEEVYSLAIVLQEEGLSLNVTIYATDFNDQALQQAKQGVYPIDKIKQYSQNYRQAGGKFSLSRYYHAEHGSVIMDNSLKKNIVFANHNLVGDSVFGEMNLIQCRNVFIYFDRQLQDRVFRLFQDSLIYDGFLCLGKKESMHFYEGSLNFNVVDKKAQIYQKKNYV